jgi:hypothetical protein
MGNEEKNYLQGLRGDVLNGLVAVSDSFADDDSVSYELLISLARNTGNKKLLGRAFDRIKTIEDPKQRGDAMLALLDEIELSLANFTTPEQTESAETSTTAESIEEEQPASTENEQQSESAGDRQ